MFTFKMQMEKIHKREKEIKVESFSRFLLMKKSERNNMVIHVRFANKHDFLFNLIDLNMNKG